METGGEPRYHHRQPAMTATTKYLQFMQGFRNAVAPFDCKIKSLHQAQENADPADSATYERLFNELVTAELRKEIAIAEYAGIPSTSVALAELQAATCGFHGSAYAYKVLDDLPSDYCAD